MSADETSKMIGGFRILRDLKAGAGSQGTVYQAVCEKACLPTVAVGDVVALKVMAMQDDDGEEFARLEKRTSDMVRLDHPNVVKYHGCFRESGPFSDIHVIVLEFVEGISLRERLAAAPCGLGVDEAMRLALGLVDGLAYTSSLGLVHRDIKPGNVIVRPDGTPKLIDFEVAHCEGGTATIGGGNMIGTFDYMAPDFTNADFRGDVLSDVFSMGVVLHEMLTGRTPYRRQSGTSSQANVVFLQRWLAAGSDPIRVSSRIGKLLPGANELFERVLSSDRTKRIPDFAVFREALGKVRFRELAHGERTWRLQNYIGHGGYGEVFGAVDCTTGARVAVKHLLNAAGLDRFRREANAMRRVGDSCFPKFVDWFTAEDGGAFLVMEYLDGMPGQSLKDVLRPCPGRGLGRETVVRAFVRYARGLGDLHALGLVHRDVKPANLYFPSAAPDRAAIMDLGIARDMSGTATAGQVPGTVDYMPPECVTGQTRGGPEADVWSLGLCLYEALTGRTAYPRLPEGAAAFTACFERVNRSEQPDFSGVADDREMLALLQEMCAVAPEKRIRDIRLVERRLRIASGENPENLPAPSEDFVWKECPVDADFAEDADLEPPTGSTLATALGDDDVLALLQEDLSRKRRHGGRRMRFALLALLALLTLAAGGAVAWWIAEQRRERAIAAADERARAAAAEAREREEALRREEDERRKAELARQREEALRKERAMAAEKARQAKEAAERLKKEKEETERRALAKKAEEERQRKAAEELVRKAREKRAEEERLAKEKADAERAAKAKRAEEERLVKEKTERDRRARQVEEASERERKAKLKALDDSFAAYTLEYERKRDVALKPGSVVDPEKLQQEYLVRRQAYRSARKKLQEQQKPSEGGR